MFEKKNNLGKYALFFFIGGAIGAGLALLFAPMTGRKMQKQLKEVLDDQVENVQSVVENVQSVVRKVVAT